MHPSSSLYRQHPNITLTITAVVIVLSLVILSGSWVGRWLVINQPPKRSDAIIVLGGGPINRLERGATLYHERYAPHMILSGGSPGIGQLTQAQVMAWQSVHQFGIPKRALALDNRSQTTYQNAINSRRIMLEHHWDSAIVVSSDYHMRRVSFLFSWVFRQSPIRLTYVAASDPWFRPGRWWANPKSAEITVGEYLKLAVNVLQVEIPHGMALMTRLATSTADSKDEG